MCSISNNTTLFIYPFYIVTMLAIVLIYWNNVWVFMSSFGQGASEIIPQEMLTFTLEVNGYTKDT